MALRCTTVLGILLVSISHSLSAQTDSIVLSSDTVIVSERAIQDSTPAFFTSLSGSLPPLLVKVQSPYFVEADIFVSPGSTVSIEAGVVVLFGNFTVLHIQGALYAKGTKEHPVVFTSVNDQKYNRTALVSAAPYDWNGIDIYESAIGTMFDSCIVQYSVYGIRSQTDQIKILGSHFLQNGKSNVAVKDSIFTIPSNPFTYTPLPTIPAVRPTDTLTPIPKIAVPPTASTQAVKGSTLQLLFRYSGMVLAAGCFAAATLEYDRYKKAENEFDLINTKTDQNMQTYTSRDWNTAKNRVERETTITSVLAGMGATGVLLFSVSFAF